ncbi:HAD family hydrolase [Szabonella alba]|uniref:phosphoglycolate phosphatase n=1 Tax=Szabonella alba TaxID=2804194 RepID=A0A8K0VBK6_9RHOB|nr:HAD-IA family hydrolase [Szabonella alba]MBL4916754.1 HAD-IA family hydrolase [Szabonella alba]
MKAILFDCDGVLIDSEPMGCAALAAAITAAGHDMTPEEASAIFPGNAARDSSAWITAQGLDGPAVMAEADRMLFAMFDRAVPLIPGIGAVLSAFDLPMAVCSNSSVARLEHSLGRTPLIGHFRGHVYSAAQVPQPKPAPDLALFAAARLGVLPQDAVFVDDNPHGITCARAAGCLAIGFIGPADHRRGLEARLRAAGAHHIARGSAELLALLHHHHSPSMKAV